MNKPVKRLKITISTLLEDFILEKKASGINENTIEDYLYSYNRLISDLNLEPLEIVHTDIVKWIEFLKTKGNKPATINHHLSQCRVVLYWLMQQEQIESFKIKLIKFQEEEIKAYPDADVLKLIEKPGRSCNFAEYRAWMIVCFILSTGARASTVVNIKKSDIDYTNSTIAYRHLKNKKIFYAPMSMELEKYIKNYFKTWDIDSEYLFCTCDGKQLTTKNLTKSINKFCIKRGVVPKGIHALRHNFAKAWVKNGGNAFVLQKMLTHSDITMTKRYVRLFDDEIKDDVQKFNALSCFNKIS